MTKFFEEYKLVAIIYFLETNSNQWEEKSTSFFNNIDLNVTFGNLKETNVFFQESFIVDISYFSSSTSKSYSYFMIDISWFSLS